MVLLQPVSAYSEGKFEELSVEEALRKSVDAGRHLAEQTPAPLPNRRVDSVEAVLLACVVNGVLLASTFLAMEVLVRWPVSRRYIAPKVGDGVPRWTNLRWLLAAWHDRRKPHVLPPDGEVMVRFCEFGLKFCIGGTFFDLVLLPMYATGHGTAMGFNVFSLSNLQPGAPRFWGVVVAAYAMIGMFAHLVISEWHDFLTRRRDRFARAARGDTGPHAAQARRTLLVENLQSQGRSEEYIVNFFEELFGRSSVHSCQVQKDTQALYRIADIEDATSCCGNRKPSSSTEAEALQPTNLELSEDVNAGAWPLAGLPEGLRERALQMARSLHGTSSERSTSTAFVTMRSVANCVTAKQALLSHTTGWEIFSAPEPRDLIWRNVPVPIAQARVRYRIALAAVSFGILFWSAPVTMIQAWANMSTLEKWIPSVGNLRDWSPTSFALLTTYLPVLALLLLQAILPAIFEASAKWYERHKALSEVQRSVLNRCFGYQLASLYVINMSGSVWLSLQSIIDRPSSILTILGKTLPGVAVYFVTFVLARIGVSLPLLLLRPWDVPFSGKASPARCSFGSQAADMSLVLVIGLSYSFIAPAILPVCALYFWLAALVYRYLFTYVYEPEFDSGGIFWYDLFNSVLLGLLLGTLSLLALSLVFADTWQFASLVPLPFLVLALGMYCWSHYGFQSKLVSLEDAVRADREENPAITLASDLYEDPVLSRADRQEERQP